MMKDLKLQKQYFEKIKTNRIENNLPEKYGKKKNHSPQGQQKTSIPCLSKNCSPEKNRKTIWPPAKKKKS